MDPLLTSSSTDMSAYAAILPFIIVLMLWDTVWKALALYRAGYNRSPLWFFFLLILNTVGILPILYLFIWGRKKN